MFFVLFIFINDKFLLISNQNKANLKTKQKFVFCVLFINTD